MAVLKLITAGSKLKIVLVASEEETMEESLGRIDPGLRAQAKAKVFALMKRLATDGYLRTPEFFNKESSLPDGTHFYAIKTNSKLRIRAYGWFSSKNAGTFIVSHYAFKRGEKLESRDTARVIENWRSIEK